jgi:hypothetical protein
VTPFASKRAGGRNGWQSKTKAQRNSHVRFANAFQFNSGGRGAKALMEMPSVVVLPA